MLLAESIGTVSECGLSQSSYNRQLKIWVFTLTQQCPLIGRCLKHARLVISIFVRCVTFGLLSLLRLPKSGSCSNSWFPTWFLQFSPGWHIHFKSGLPSAGPEHSCSCSRTKTSVLPHRIPVLIWFALASGSPQQLALKSHTAAYRVLQFQQPSGNLASLHIAILYRRDSLRSSSSLSICGPIRKPYMAAGARSFSSVASGIMECTAESICRHSQLFTVFRRALKHHLFAAWRYPDSSAKSGMIKPAQCISLRDLQCQLLSSHSP